MNRIIARTSEIDTLERKFNSGKSEFVIVYGRRRIGKTFLVNNVFADRLTFAYVGARKQKPKKQLQRFAEQLKSYSCSPFAPVLANWDEAFQALRTLIESKPKETRKVVFFDEMPWIDTPRSSFVEALEYFWNAWAAQRNDILFIACGSATSWMVNKLVKNKGGLHNRITEQIYLRPFRLGECEEYLHANGCVWDRYTILQCYMALGGVPYYMSLLNPEQSLAQNIDRLFFVKNAPMREEFDELFNALYSHADKYRLRLSKKQGNREAGSPKCLRIWNAAISSKLTRNTSHPSETRSIASATHTHCFISSSWTGKIPKTNIGGQTTCIPIRWSRGRDSALKPSA